MQNTVCLSATAGNKEQFPPSPYDKIYFISSWKVCYVKADHWSYINKHHGEKSQAEVAPN